MFIILLVYTVAFKLLKEPESYDFYLFYLFCDRRILLLKKKKEQGKGLKSIGLYEVSLKIG